MANNDVVRYSKKGLSPTVRALGGGSVGINWERDRQPGKMEQTTQLLGAIMSSIDENKQKKKKEQKDSFDMYKTLRESGYEPKAAFEAVTSGNFPSEPGGKTTDEVKDESVINKNNAQTDYYKARTEKEKKQGVVGRNVFVVTDTGELKKVGEVGKDDKIFKNSRSSQNFTVNELQEILASSRYSSQQKKAAQKMLNNRLGVEAGNVKGVKMSKGGTTRLIHPEDVELAKEQGWESA